MRELALSARSPDGKRQGSPKKPRYVKAYRDRHGVLRHYYRRPGWPVAALKGDIGTEEFQDSYREAEARLGATQASRAKSPPPAPRRGFVYAIRVRGFDLVKVGFSSEPDRRKLELEGGAHMKDGMEILVRVPGTVSTERALHRRFAKQRLFGEWFQLSGPLAEWISAHEREAGARLAG